MIFKPFKDHAIKNKVTVFILTSTFFAVVALSTVFMIQRQASFEAQIENEFATITKIIADRSNAAIAFEDRVALHATLSSFSFHSDVLIACIFNVSGELLAEYKAVFQKLDCPEQPRSHQLRIDNTTIELSEPILVDNKMAGTIYVSASTRKMQRELHTAFTNIAGLSLIMFIAAIAFARYIQRFVSDPLVELKDAAAQVSLDNTKFEPLDKQNADEIGELVDAFNQMQSTIATQNAVILDNTNTLEKKVEERTVDLALANKELEAFSYSVSHDLKAPLRIIEGYSAALDEDYGEDLDETAMKYLNKVRQSTHKMSQLINSLLVLSRVTRLEITKVTIDFTRLVEQVADEVRANNPEKENIILIEPNMRIMGDHDLIEIILDNLIGNAWKYSQKKEHVRIEVGTDIFKGEHVYYVRDNGAGFNMKYADLLLKPFKRLHTPQEFEGNGIGLATVNRIVERHQGKLWFESTQGVGSIFYFNLFPGSSESMGDKGNDDDLPLDVQASG